MATHPVRQGLQRRLRAANVVSVSPIVREHVRMTIPAATRREVNEAEVRRYFSSWDPTWRWILLVSLRDMRANLARFGRLAAEEMGNETWAEEEYVYGPLALGITAAAVNEASQHCEDLFALLTFLREPLNFARRMGNYGAGRVIRIADQLAVDSDAGMASRFCVPSIDVIEAGFVNSKDPEAALDAARAGIARLGELVRRVVDFYKTYEFFHLQYKHGLKILFRPFGGAPTAETIAERKTDVRAPLFALSNEALSRTLQRPPRQQTLMFQAGPEAQPHLAELITNHDLLRVQIAGPPVDLDGVIAHSWTVSRLLRLAAANRQSLGRVLQQGKQTFELPGEGDRETLSLVIEPPCAVGPNDVMG